MGVAGGGERGECGHGGGVWVYDAVADAVEGCCEAEVGAAFVCSHDESGRVSGIGLIARSTRAVIGVGRGLIPVSAIKQLIATHGMV